MNYLNQVPAATGAGKSPCTSWEDSPALGPASALGRVPAACVLPFPPSLQPLWPLPRPFAQA